MIDSKSVAAIARQLSYLNKRMVSAGKLKKELAKSNQALVERLIKAIQAQTRAAEAQTVQLKRIADAEERRERAQGLTPPKPDGIASMFTG